MDVPNATLMVVENADRFGLSQLHQLRGRVGRGTREGLLRARYPTATARRPCQRLRALCATNDGFRIAEEDLQLRGPRRLFRQPPARPAGVPSWATLRTDLPLLQQAQEAGGTDRAADTDAHAARSGSARGGARACLPGATIR